QGDKSVLDRGGGVGGVGKVIDGAGVGGFRVRRDAPLDGVVEEGGTGDGDGAVEIEDGPAETAAAPALAEKVRATVAALGGVGLEGAIGEGSGAALIEEGAAEAGAAARYIGAAV